MLVLVDQMIGFGRNDHALRLTFETRLVCFALRTSESVSEAASNSPISTSLDSCESKTLWMARAR